MDITTSCPHCGSENLIQIIGKLEPTQHYGRLSCGDCHTWIKWLPDPRITKLAKDRSEFIIGLLGYSSLSPWERNFLSSIKEERHLTPKQSLQFDKIALRCRGKRFDGKTYCDYQVRKARINVNKAKNKGLI